MTPTIAQAKRRPKVIIAGRDGLPARTAVLHGIDHRDRCLVEFPAGNKARVPLHLVTIEAPA